MSTAAERLRQRADYTHKFNAKTGRHGWLRLTPAYSVKIVEELIARCENPQRILDPFCGTATTALSAAYHGHSGTTTDINPFLVWLGQAKTAHYSALQLAATRHACKRAVELVKKEAVEPVATPPIHNIERWWSPEALAFLRLLRAAIDKVAERETAEHSLLLIAFCRTLISLSNASFNHQSMSFKDDKQLPLVHVDMGGLFGDNVGFVLNGAEENPLGESRVVLGDARSLPAAVDGKFDLVITSPPYANRMSYIRELRPYMYWLGYLVNGRDAGELDWTSIGGTWGIATSRLADWTSANGHHLPPNLPAIMDKIADGRNANGELLANYVRKYFDDIYEHLASLTHVLAKGARVHYIVGNSTFYGVLVPVEALYAEIMKGLGFSDVSIRAVRKRNSKKELVEFDVSAVWGKKASTMKGVKYEQGARQDSLPAA